MGSAVHDRHRAAVGGDGRIVRFRGHVPPSTSSAVRHRVAIRVSQTDGVSDFMSESAEQITTL